MGSSWSSSIVVSNDKHGNDGFTDHNAGTNYINRSHIFFDVGNNGSSVEDKMYRPNSGTLI
jgi:hypothetical protein